MQQAVPRQEQSEMRIHSTKLKGTIAEFKLQPEGVTEQTDWTLKRKQQDLERLSEP